MTKEEMMNKIIRKYGFENPKTVLFFTVCEKEKDLQKIETIYKKFI